MVGIPSLAGSTVQVNVVLALAPVADSAPMRILQPITRTWYAEMLAAQGDLARARVTLAEALALYESIGMPGYAQRASERLATL